MLRSARRGAVPLLLGPTLLAGATAVSTGPARAASIYSGTTDASGIRLSINDPEIVPLLSGGGTDVSSPQSQTTADSFGRARGLASLAYPGDDVAGLTSFIGVALPPGAPVRDLPAYPLTVIADQNTPHPDAMTSPAYDLQADVTSTRTSSTASAGASPLISPGGNATASGSVTSTADGGLVAQAAATTTGFQLAGLVSLGTVTTTATATRTPTGALQRKTSFDLTGASIAGLPLAVSNGKLVVPVLGGTVEVSEAIDQLPVLAPLREQGLTITLQRAKNTPDGVTAAGLRITLVRDIPALPLPSVPLPQLIPQQPQVGPLPASTLTVVYTVGYASASASLSSFPDFSSSGSSGGTDVVSDPAATAVAPAASLPGLSSDLAPGATSPEVLPPAMAATAAPVLASRAARTPLDVSGLYLAVALTALGALALSQLVRYASIRTGATP